MKHVEIRTLTMAAILLMAAALTAPVQAQEGAPRFGAEAGLPPVSQGQEPESAAAAEGDETVAGAAAKEGEEGEEEDARTFGTLWAMGGNIMYLLALTSVLAVGIILERLLALRNNAVIPRRFMRQIMDHWRKREINQVLSICGSSNVSIARVLRAGMIHFDEGIARMEDAVDAAGDHEATLLRRNLGLLAAIGNIATMLGLLGTVLGMIESFDLIAKTGTGDARVVAGGIFQALITTAAGLMVGIFAVASHSFLRRKVEILEIRLEETSKRLLEELSIERGGSSTSSEPSPAGNLQPAEA